MVTTSSRKPATQPAGTPATDDQAAAEFADYQANPAAPTPDPAPRVPLAAEEPATRPRLTIATFIRPLETMAINGQLYRMHYCQDYTVGRQVYLSKTRTTQISLRMQEEVGVILDAEESATQRFMLEEVFKAALPTVPEHLYSTMATEELELVVGLFFDRSKELRDGTRARASLPTSGASSPGSNASITAIPANGST